MRYYAILDTNVLVSAMLKAGSVPGKIAAEALNGDIIPVINDDIIAEYEDVCGYSERNVRYYKGRQIVITD